MKQHTRGSTFARARHSVRAVLCIKGVLRTARPTLADPVTPEEEIDAVVEQVPDPNSGSEKPHRAGQSLAAPPSRAAHVFSSFLNN